MAGSLTPIAIAQDAAQRPPRMAARLVALPQLASIATAPSAVEVTIRLDAGSPAAAGQPSAAANPLEVIASRAVGDSLVIERDPQLSEDQLVVVAVDQQGNEVGWQLVKDPTVLRSEQPDASGLLSGQTLRQPGSFVALVPRNLSTVTELRVYRPRWTGRTFELDRVGAVAIRMDQRL